MNARIESIKTHANFAELCDVERKLKALKRGVGGRSAISALHGRAFDLEGQIMRDTGASMLEVQTCSGGLW